MSDFELPTENLRLVLQTLDQVMALLAGLTPQEKAEISPDWLARMRFTTPGPWTHGFSMVQRGTNATVGTCAYKGPPTSDGIVEIAYSVDAPHRRRGYATEAARALVKHAFSTGEVQKVVAHTEPQENASTHVLVKCGFKRIGEIEDPEDGVVWRWELQKV